MNTNHTNAIVNLGYNMFPKVRMESYGGSMLPYASGTPVSLWDQTDAGLYVLVRWSSPFDGHAITESMRLAAAQEFLRRYPTDEDLTTWGHDTHERARELCKGEQK